MRCWRGEATADDADAFLAFLRREAAPVVEAARGNVGIRTLRRIERGRALFLVISTWESLAAVRGFTGPDRMRSVPFESVDRFLIERDETVEHYVQLGRVAEPRGSFVAIWRYEVAPERREAFEAAYGPSGEWVRLFGEGPGYVGSRLLHSIDRTTLYLTADEWESREARDAFLRSHRAEYQSLDRRLDPLMLAETHVGDFDDVTG